MKRLALVISLIGTTLLLFACIGTSRQTSEMDKTEDKIPLGDNNGPIRIGFSMDTLLEDRWLRDRDLFRESVEALGAEVEIVAANGDDALQITQAEELIQSGIDLLVIVPHNAEATAAIVHKAHREGIQVIAYDRLVKNADLDMYVSFDNEQVGEMQAKAITALVPKGNYVFVGGAITDNNAHLLKKGVFKVLQPYIDRGDIRIVYDQWTKDWTPANAKANMEEALRTTNGQIDAVIAANDATAGGAIQALAAWGLAGKVPVAGQDADLAGVQRIVSGTQTMTVYKPIHMLTEAVAEIAVKMAKGEQVTTEQSINNGKAEIPSLLITPIAVHKQNINSTIISDGFHSYEDVYQPASE